jgi:hypothetical protein
MPAFWRSSINSRLELRDGAQDGEHEAAGGGIRVQCGAAEVEDAEAGSLGVQPLYDLDEIGGRACQTVELAGNQRVPFAHPIEGGFKLRPGADCAGLLGKGLVAAGGFQGGLLSLEAGGLVDGRCSRVCN